MGEEFDPDFLLPGRFMDDFPVPGPDKPSLFSRLSFRHEEEINTGSFLDADRFPRTVFNANPLI
jgi:hypothetical protein